MGKVIRRALLAAWALFGVGVLTVVIFREAVPKILLRTIGDYLETLTIATAALALLWLYRSGTRRERTK
jgi:hypothetical protein